MQLLDAILAFALTMAALATVVTVIMEAGLRIARMRKKNFIEVMKLLNKELDKGALNMTPGERWDFFVKAVKNPAEAAAGVLTKDANTLLAGMEKDVERNAVVEQHIASLGRDTSAALIILQGGWEFLQRIFGKNEMAKADSDGAVSSGQSASPEELNPENKVETGFLAFLRRDLAQTAIDMMRLFGFLKQLGGDKKRAALYENVSLEYMLRCLAETPSVQKASQSASSALKVEFNRIAKKYEEFGSSVSASFKHHTRSWSIGIGIVLALVVNVDGLRIFEAYLADSSLAATVIEKQDDLLKTYTKAEASREKIETVEAQYANAKTALEKAREGEKTAEIDAAEAALKKAEKKLEEISDVGKIKEDIQDAQKHVSDLVSMGVPIGWNYYPNCPYGEKASVWDQKFPKCKNISDKERDFRSKSVFVRVMRTLDADRQNAVLWFFTVIISGVLIGLGAPFWFDVAKRLSQIRKGLKNPNASAEDRLSARDANGDAEERKKIVEAVVTDAAMETAASGVEPPNNFMGPRGLIL